MFYDKYDFIVQHIEGKEVLDIGCVEMHDNFTPDNMKKTQHYRLKAHAKRLVGIDLEKDGVDALNDAGCECYVSFAENIGELNLGTFEIILLGDIIEHIPNPQSFLYALRPLLCDDGVIICTTPNCLSFRLQLFLLLKKTFTRRQHVAWYCRVTLRNIFAYSGYEEVSCSYGVFWKNGRFPVLKLFEKLLFKINPEYAHHLLCIYRLQKSFSQDDMTRLQKKRVL